MNSNIPTLTREEAITYLRFIYEQHPGRSLSEIIELFEKEENFVDLKGIDQASAVLARTTPQPSQNSSAPSLVKPRPLYLCKGGIDWSHYQNILTLYAVSQYIKFGLCPDKNYQQALNDQKELSVAISEKASEDASKKATQAAIRRAKNNHQITQVAPKEKFVSTEEALKKTKNNSFLNFGRKAIDAYLPRQDSNAVHDLRREIDDDGDEHHSDRLAKVLAMSQQIVRKLHSRYQSTK